MSAAIWATLGSLAAIALIVLKYIFSGDAAKSKALADFLAAEKARQDQIDAQEQAAQQGAAHTSAGANAAQDAADAEAAKIQQGNP